MTIPRMGIYAIEGPNNGIYVGSAKSIAVRFRQHRWALDHNRHLNRHLQAAWNKYGADAFIFSILEEVLDAKQLIAAEQRWLDTTFATRAKQCIYNICIQAGNTLGVACSEETKRKISAKNAGRIKGPPTEENRKKAGDARRGIRHSLESRLRMSAAQKKAVATKGKTLNAVHTRSVTDEEKRRRAFTRGGGKVYVFIDPTGKRYPDIIDVTTFARSHGLDPSSLLKMIKASNGHTQHRGWTGHEQAIREQLCIQLPMNLFDP
jgi:group I intron endonuclease